MPCFLGQRPAAIVSPIEGTTRDLLDVTLNIGGYPIIITDTAGLRSETEDIIEKEGISRALQSSESADLVILVIDCLKYLQWVKTSPDRNFTDFVNHTADKLKLNNIIKHSNGDETFTKERLLVFNKFDLIPEQDKCQFDNLKSKALFISCKTETGFNDLISEMTEKLKHL